MVKRGDIYFADLSPVVGSEQGGVRPVLVVQNNLGNHFSPTIIVAAITAKMAKPKLPTHIGINSDETGIEKDSVILLEQIRTMKSTKTNWIFLKATDLVRFAKHSLSKSERDG